MYAPSLDAALSSTQHLRPQRASSAAIRMPLEMPSAALQRLLFFVMAIGFVSDVAPLRFHSLRPEVKNPAIASAAAPPTAADSPPKVSS